MQSAANVQFEEALLGQNKQVDILPFTDFSSLLRVSPALDHISVHTVVCNFEDQPRKRIAERKRLPIKTQHRLVHTL